MRLTIVTILLVINVYSIHIRELFQPSSECAIISKRAYRIGRLYSTKKLFKYGGMSHMYVRLYTRAIIKMRTKKKEKNIRHTQQKQKRKKEKGKNDTHERG